MTSTVVVTAYPAGDVNVVRVIKYRDDDNDPEETFLQHGATASFYVCPGDRLSIEEACVNVVMSPPPPRKPTEE